MQRNQDKNVKFLNVNIKRKLSEVYRESLERKLAEVTRKV